MIESIQYISQNFSDLSHLDNIKKVCESGVKWVQLRVKGLSSEKWLEIALAAREICDEHHVTLIINDGVEVALHSAADGVHLGKSDMPVSKARQLMGAGKIIGGTANTFEDIVALAAEGADYIGLGPFRFTTTKENLSPVLGLDGYKIIMNQCVEAGITIPVFAIGGIEEEDVAELMTTGITGIAASGMISKSLDQKALITRLEEIILTQKGALC